MGHAGRAPYPPDGGGGVKGQLLPSDGPYAGGTLGQEWWAGRREIRERSYVTRTGKSPCQGAAQSRPCGPGSGGCARWSSSRRTQGTPPRTGTGGLIPVCACRSTCRRGGSICSTRGAPPGRPAGHLPTPEGGLSEPPSHTARIDTAEGWGGRSCPFSTSLGVRVLGHTAISTGGPPVQPGWTGWKSPSIPSELFIIQHKITYLYHFKMFTGLGWTWHPRGLCFRISQVPVLVTSIPWGPGAGRMPAAPLPGSDSGGRTVSVPIPGAGWSVFNHGPRPPGMPLGEAT